MCVVTQSFRPMLCTRMRLLSAVVCWCLAVGMVRSSVAATAPPVPKPWPEKFHSVLVMNYSGIVDIIDLWYEWPKGRNFNIIRHQLDDDVVYDLEWNNGTSFIYSRNSCSTVHLPVGILRPTWLEGAAYLGQRHVDGFLCNVWEKVDFIWYYEDVVTKRPVHWEFYTGRRAHVMTFDVGAALDDTHWQAPLHCFNQPNTTDFTVAGVSLHHHLSSAVAS